jgi:hypothetical protein
MPDGRIVRRGTCDTCGYRLPLRKDGTVQSHHLYSGHDRCEESCAGSGKPPRHAEANRLAREADLLASALAEIRQRYSMCNYSAGTHSPRAYSVAMASTSDVPRLLAALDAALELAEQWQAKCGELWDQISAQDLDGASAGFKGIGASVNGEHAKELREAISRTLLREDGHG